MFILIFKHLLFSQETNELSFHDNPYNNKNTEFKNHIESDEIENIKNISNKTSLNKSLIIEKDPSLSNEGDEKNHRISQKGIKTFKTAEDRIQSLKNEIRNLIAPNLSKKKEVYCEIYRDIVNYYLDEITKIKGNKKEIIHFLIDLKCFVINMGGIYSSSTEWDGFFQRSLEKLGREMPRI